VGGVRWQSILRDALLEIERLLSFVTLEHREESLEVARTSEQAESPCKRSCSLALPTKLGVSPPVYDADSEQAEARGSRRFAYESVMVVAFPPDASTRSEYPNVCGSKSASKSLVDLVLLVT